MSKGRRIDLVAAAGAVLSGYGAMNTSQYRRAALLIAGVVLTVLGILAILSIGYPILAAGILSLIAGARANR